MYVRLKEFTNDFHMVQNLISLININLPQRTLYYVIHHKKYHTQVLLGVL